MSKPLQNKREFYRQREISDSYDEQRFGGPSGARVNAREMALVLDMLPSGGRVLDLACGTGRLTKALRDRGQPVVALDASAPMAQKAAATGAPTVIADAFATPWKGQFFEAVVSLRFAFHFRHLHPLLKEMQRLTCPGGTLVFDTYTWSPRAAWALGTRRWGGRVYLHSRQEVARVADEFGLHVERFEPCFLFSPYVYRLLPLPVERAVEALERYVPASWLCRIFWQLKA